MRNFNLSDIGLFILIALLISACAPEEKPVVEKTIRPVKFGKIIMSGDALSETFSGSAQSSKETKMSFRVGGTITRLNIKVGDVIQKGQLIAKLDQTDYSVQHQQSVASLKSVETQIQSSKSQLINSKATYMRIEKLYENNSVSISEFEQAKNAYEVAKATYEAALAQANASKKQVESSQNQVNYSTLRAPFSGVITSLNAEENEIIGAGAPIATLSAMRNPEISVGIPEVFISQIQKNQHVGILFSVLPTQTFSGHVYEVGFSSLGGSTYPVTVRIDKPTSEIRPGMVADVHFHFGNESSQRMVAPTAAIGQDDNGHFVFALVQEGDNYLAKKKPIQIGALTAAGFEVKSGLSNGNLVATAGLDMLLDGMQVRLME